MITLITGASRGLGKALAESLAGEGQHLLLLARTVGALESVDDAVRKKGGTATLIPCDLLAPARPHEPHPLDALGALIYERFGRLDRVIFAAAQAGPASPLGHITPEEWQRVMNINALAPLRLLRSVDPILRATAKEGNRAPQVLALTCAVGRAPAPYLSAYGASKAALENAILAYAAEMQNLGITAALCDPGPMATRLRGQLFPGEDQSKVPTPEARAAMIHELLTAGLTPAMRYDLSQK